MKSSLSEADQARLEYEVFRKVREVDEDGPVYGIDYAEMQSLSSIWGFAELYMDTFEKRCEAFLWILRRLLDSGRVKLHKNGQILEGTTEELVQLFRDAFPATPLDADRIVFLPGDRDIGTGKGMNLWWFMDECPGQAVWIDQDTGEAYLTD